MAQPHDDECLVVLSEDEDEDDSLLKTTSSMLQANTATCIFLDDIEQEGSKETVEIISPGDTNTYDKLCKAAIISETTSFVPTTETSRESVVSITESK